MIRAIVVEDEPLARRDLISLLARTGRVKVVGEAADAPGGLRLCQQSAADVAFLGGRLSGQDGLRLGVLLAGLPHRPLFVFVSAHSEHAADAFRIHAADYLLKPLVPDRVDESVLHLEQRLREYRAARMEASTDGLPVRLRHRDVARLLARHEVVAVLRRGRHTCIHSLEEEFPTYYSLSRVKSWLGGEPFFRAGRHAIINLAFVGEIVHYGDRLYRLTLMDRSKTVVDVSRSAASVLSSLLRPRF